ncbi:MAG TPA: beta-galactosidase, partial [Clostridia bacterium]|nr:beta-galactosidase [Clostridia bacterium]
LRTKDKKYLVRTPCLNDPHFWEENDKNIERNVTRNRKYGPVAYFAQDEGSLTCYTDELEFCYCPHCMRRMREWLQGTYPSLEALNQSWNTSFASWDEVIPHTTQEARQSRDYASWGDHRRFMELSYADSYRQFSRMITKHDPQGRVRMSGCQASTAFSGNDYDLLHQHVRYFEAYPVGNQYEFHRSFKSDETILGGWFGYGSQGKHVQNRIWYALFHGLTLISIFWEYACLN